MDEIDGIVRRMHADEAHADGDFVGAGFLTDDRQRAQSDLLGGFKSCRGGGTQAELKLPGVDLREDLRADEGKQDADGEDDATEVSGDEDVTRGERGKENPAQCGFACGFGFRFGTWFGVPPNVQDRHQRAGEQIRGDHAEADGERQWQEERFGGAGHEEARHEDGENAEHGKRARADGFFGGVQHQPGKRTAAALFHVAMDVFDFDGGLIHQDADGEREAAQGHEIDGVTTDPQREHGGGDGEGDVQDDDEGAAQIPQEEEHHQAGERGTKDAFLDEIADGADDPGALIKLERDVDVLGAGRLEFGDVLLHQFDDAEGGGVAAFGDGHVHRAFAVHHGDAVHHVAAVADFADVAHIDGSLVGDLDRHGSEILDVFDDGVGGDDGEAVGQREIAAGADGVGGGHRGDDVIG